MKPFLFVVSLACVAPSLALVAACSSSNDGSNGTGGTDASTSETSTGDSGSTPHADAGGGTPSDGATGDVSVADGSSGDGNSSDTGPIETDGATPSCNAPSDCRLYSSSCETCTCVSRGKNDPDPTCTGSTVSCFIDPCEGKMATCDNGHCGGK